jgi:hypothetical protein
MSAIHQIEAAHARNLAVQRSRLASVPEVGIFWRIDNKLVADSIRWPQTDVYGGFYNGKNDHATFWATLQRFQPLWKGNDYTDFPRGQVLFDSKEKIFLVYSSQAIVNSLELRKMILAEFNLPLAAAKFVADYHYENAIPPLLDEDFDGSHA